MQICYYTYHAITNLLSESITKMIQLVYLVILMISFFESMEAISLETNVTSIENTLRSLTHNVSTLRKDMVSAEVLNLYLNQESAFRKHSTTATA